jgi:hypothetical protein
LRRSRPPIPHASASRPSSRSIRPIATSDEAGTPLLDEDYLILSTIHSAKGQEWKSVLVLNVVDGCIPSDLGTGSSGGDRGGAAPALRAMTRAKDHLHLIMPQRFFAHQQKSNGDRHMYAARTRFITGAMLDRFESCAWPSAGAADGRNEVDRRARPTSPCACAACGLSTRSGGLDRSLAGSLPRTLRTFIQSSMALLMPRPRRLVECRLV